MSRCALLLDFGGTLDADGSPWGERFHALYRAAGGGEDAATFADAFTASDRALLRMAGVERLTYSETVAAQVELLVELLPDAARLRPAAVRERFVEEARRVAARNRPVLEALSGRFRLAVVSNYQGNLQPCLDELRLGDLFAVVADSQQVGCRKPDPRIFEGALEALDCGVAGAWMIGDNPRADIAPAAALGLSTCWIAPDHRDATGVGATARAARFDLVPPLLA